MDVAQISQDLSSKVCSTMLSKFFAFGLSILVLGISAIMHQQLVATLRGHVRLIYDQGTFGIMCINEIWHICLVVLFCYLE